MTRRILGSWLLALPIVPLFAASAHASSITCYGSIVISTLGTEGMAISVPDGAVVQPTDPGAGSGSTVDAGSGATIRPATTKVGDTPAMSPTGNAGGSGGSGRVSTPPSPSVLAAQPNNGNAATVDETIPLPVELVAQPDTTVVDPPTFPVPGPHVVDSPAIDQPPQTIETIGGGVAVADTPEPATLTLLSLAGVGGWWKTRRRK